MESETVAKYQCLVVDDEIDLASATCEYFEMFGIHSAYVTNSEECLSFLKDNEVQILLLDINLKEESGFILCKKIREESNLPILFISARQSDDDILIALNIGGDDYIKKPYSLSILLAKVKVMLKRLEERDNNATKQANNQLKTIKDIAIDEDARKIYVKEREVQLKNKEFNLFLYLFHHRNRVVTKEELFSNVWGDKFFSDGTLNVHIRKIREKIEEDPNEPKYIKTIWGIGYILEL
ncbi:response regulator transcription factor [Anaeromicropila herbilytica]|uniref:Stage 0 sporulation protein A homolog n=1 Tax=Anaeromicropila herbilytica TaxID=2785025 RepID=A0A7R7ER38_9FIRM|nr:response regulator transcription factor [Anaeromicropila herbilytica]BCN32972.1 DNA-binding response regulator [Anaeromicropila herbilytica]